MEKSSRYNIARVIVTLFVIVSGIGIITVLINAVLMSESPATSRQHIEEIVPADRASNDLQIEAFAFEQTITGIEDVSIRIKNISSSAQDGLAWYIISDVESDTPWNAALYTSPTVDFSGLAPDGIFEAQFPQTPDNIEPSEYNLSFWVHTREEEGTEHADGITYWNPIWQGEAIQLTVIDTIIFQTSEDDVYDTEVTLSVLNKTSNLVSLALSYTISAPETDEPWLNAAYIAPFQYFELEPDEVYTSTYDNSLTLEDGTYTMTAYLHEIEEDTRNEIDRKEFTNSFILR